MAVKYIKAETLMDSGRDFLAGVMFVSRSRGNGKSQQLMIEMLRHIVEAAPDEDVVPVVRCEACGKREKKDEFYWCKACGYRCNEKDWFCPSGVKNE